MEFLASLHNANVTTGEHWLKVLTLLWKRIRYLEKAFKIDFDPYGLLISLKLAEFLFS